MATRKRSAIGVVGLGNMGSALASSLLERSHAVTVWNRTPEKADVFAGHEAVHVARSAAAVAARSDIVLACLADHGATMEVVATGEVAAALRGKLLLQTATVTSRESRHLSAWAGDNAVDYLDCQILDYAGDVRNGAGTIVCSGPRHLFDRHRAFLDKLAGKAVFVSETAGSAPALDKAVARLRVWCLHGLPAGCCHVRGGRRADRTVCTPAILAGNTTSQA
jgi:3-hydroxyisobutyrate dehydrogenase-like beta-hydroxyacid dehydrogenase